MKDAKLRIPNKWWTLQK